MLNKKAYMHIAPTPITTQFKTHPFVPLIRLADYTEEGETKAEKAEWLQLLKRNRVDNAFCIDDQSEVATLNPDELKTVHEYVYDFMGGEDSEVRFYRKDVTVYKHLKTNKFYAKYTKHIYNV